VVSTKSDFERFQSELFPDQPAQEKSTKQGALGGFNVRLLDCQNRAL
jgi:hypothetical protein